MSAPKRPKICHILNHDKIPSVGRDSFFYTPGRAALVELMSRYLNGLLDPFVTLLEIQKLMYFLQEAGEPLRLKYEKAYYGPYANNLRHVLNAIEGHLISGYADGGDDPGKPLELVPGAYEESAWFKRAYARVTLLPGLSIKL